MYKRILVPLDGSKLAECALPHAEELAKSCPAEEVMLISVTERVRGHTRDPEDQELYRSSEEPNLGGVGSKTIAALLAQELYRGSEGPNSETIVTFGKKEEQAERYLDGIAAKLEAKGIKVRTDVLFWPPAEAIASYAEQNDADIIVMSSHGRSGPSRWAHGSVADKVLRSSTVPVLMIRAPGCVLGI
jgi:nucleotide-binding universal stress UspA family protein